MTPEDVIKGLGHMAEFHRERAADETEALKFPSERYHTRKADLLDAALARLRTPPPEERPLTAEEDAEDRADATEFQREFERGYPAGTLTAYPMPSTTHTHPDPAAPGPEAPPPGLTPLEAIRRLKQLRDQPPAAPVTTEGEPS